MFVVSRGPGRGTGEELAGAAAGRCPNPGRSGGGRGRSAPGGVGLVAWSNAAAGRAASTYHRERQALDARLAADARVGYTDRDLAPITNRLKAMDATSAPWWIPGRPGYFDGLASQTVALRSQLRTLERQVLDRARSDAAR